jgi:hypothetical protein
MNKNVGNLRNSFRKQIANDMMLPIIPIEQKAIEIIYSALFNSSYESLYLIILLFFNSFHVRIS